MSQQTRMARIKLSSPSLEDIEKLCQQIREIAQRTGVKMKGPIPLPTRRLRVVTRKAPSGQGTHTFDKWEMRVHRRIIEIDPSDRVIRQLILLKPPEAVYMEVKLPRYS
ncbi:MAG: 30S ribosomal protein S10 [Nitrososphaerota archaeon]